MVMSLSREEIHEALDCLNDNVQLARAGLAAVFPEVAAAGTLDERASRMRAVLLQAIELLRPSRRYPFGSLESRSYDALTLRYVEDMSIQQVCDELALGRRQVYRALSQAEEALAHVLGSRAGAQDGGETQAKDSLSDELTVLASQPAQVELQEVLQGALHLVRPLAESLAVRLSFTAATEGMGYAVADRAVLKQLLVQLLSCAVQAAAGREVAVQAGEDGEALTLSLRFEADAASLPLSRLADARRIAAAQEIACAFDLESAEGAEIRLRLRRGRPVSVLVVEDNASAIELYRRYLAAGDWRLHSVSDPRLALDLARTNRPDIIVLDIMMPRLDGWSVLEMLHSHEETAGIPVVICSVVDDPELARALGACASLKKPLARGELLATLRRCLLP